MKNTEKKKSVKWLILSITTLPPLLACVILTLFAAHKMKSGLEAQVFAGLKSVATGALLSLDNVSSESFHLVDGDLYKGDYNVSQNMGATDYYAQSNEVEITFFYGDTRRATTIRDSEGNRATGTKADAEVVSAVLSQGQEYHSEDVIVDGEHFYGYYMPVKDTEGKIVGMAFAGKPKDEVTSYILSQVNVIVVIAVVIYVICVYVSVAVSRKRFLKPIEKLSSVATELSKGNINQEVKRETNDEFGDLTDAFAVLIENTDRQAHLAERMADGDLTVTYTPAGEQDVMGNAIQKMVEDNNYNLAAIQYAAEKMTAGIQEVAGASNSLAHGTTQQASAIEEMTASIAGIANSAEVNAEDAEKANELVQTTKEEALLSNNQMKQMITAMQEISEASDSVAKIMKAIDDIAFQTNIIALNASVEAARAGVHGRGFAVVAEEVRSLAGRAAEAAKDSAELIENSIQKTETGSLLAAQTAASLEQILGSVENMASLVSRIAEASASQSESVGQVNTGIAQVADVLQTNSATSEQCAAASEELSGLAGQLREAVSKYRLRAGR